MSVQESTPRSGRSKVVLGVVGAVIVVIIVLAILVLTGVTRGLFAKDIDRTVRNDVDASGLVAQVVGYQDSFRGGTLAGGQVDLDVQIDQAALGGGDLAAQPATIVMRNYSCPGADSAAANALITVDGADPAHVQARSPESGGGVALSGTFEITGVTPAQPVAQLPVGDDPVPQCRIDLAAR
ncbi:hypothetical protein GCM10023200_46870 [Actinomycetospora chlora]|uniref:Uncharacterized protein n=1 Tax=Actinomycetospora chlora TaxID=663608 RepID=A0ABP9C669_9PSEU